jgi:hypothetical protein
LLRTVGLRRRLPAAILRGQPFDCSNWTENSGASIVMPNTNMDVQVPFLGLYDIGQALRMNDD